MKEEYKKLDLLYKKSVCCPGSAYARKFKQEIDDILLSFSEEDRKNYFKYRYNNKTQKRKNTAKKGGAPVWQRKTPKAYELKASVGRTQNNEKNNECKKCESHIKPAGIFKLETDLATNEISCCQHPGCKATATINGYCKFHNKYQNAESK